YSKGTMIGEFSLTDTLPRAVTTACLEDAELLLLSKESLDRLLVDHPAIGIELLKGILMALSIRLRKSFERLASIF
ncbi:MAG: hypothetical protein P8X63_14840, partial [Desulfuromonadaceae bacterium]